MRGYSLDKTVLLEKGYTLDLVYFQCAKTCTFLQTEMYSTPGLWKDLTKMKTFML